MVTAGKKRSTRTAAIAGNSWRNRTSARRFATVAACCASIAPLLVACGGGLNGGSQAAASASFCRSLANGWPTLEKAMSSTRTAKIAMIGPLADKSEVSRELIADQALYQSASTLAATLAKSAPTRIWNDYFKTAENAQEQLFTLSAGFASIANGDTQGLDEVRDPTDFNAGNTGCNFVPLGGPDGTVATLFTS